MYKATYLPKHRICDDVNNLEFSGRKNSENLLNIQNDGKMSAILNSLNIYNNEKFRSFKSKENIHKKEVGPYRSFGY